MAWLAINLLLAEHSFALKLLLPSSPYTCVLGLAERACVVIGKMARISHDNKGPPQCWANTYFCRCSLGLICVLDSSPAEYMRVRDMSLLFFLHDADLLQCELSMGGVTPTSSPAYSHGYVRRTPTPLRNQKPGRTEDFEHKTILGSTRFQTLVILGYWPGRASV